MPTFSSVFRIAVRLREEIAAEKLLYIASFWNKQLSAGMYSEKTAEDFSVSGSLAIQREIRSAKDSSIKPFLEKF